MLTTVKQLALFAIVATGFALAATPNSASAADHRESPGFLLSGGSDALMLDVLDWMGIEPHTGPLPQTREHILLARITHSTTSTQSDGRLELQIYRLTRREARRVIWILLLLEDHHNPDPAAVYFIRYLRQTKTTETG